MQGVDELRTSGDRALVPQKRQREDNYEEFNNDVVPSDNNIERERLRQERKKIEMDLVQYKANEAAKEDIRRRKEYNKGEQRKYDMLVKQTEQRDEYRNKPAESGSKGGYGPGNATMVWYYVLAGILGAVAIGLSIFAMTKSTQLILPGIIGLVLFGAVLVLWRYILKNLQPLLAPKNGGWFAILMLVPFFTTFVIMAVIFAIFTLDTANEYPCYQATSGNPVPAFSQDKASPQVEVPDWKFNYTTGVCDPK